MIKKYIIPFLILPIGVLLGSCEDFFLKDIDVDDLPPYEKIMVVQGFISPQQDSIKIALKFTLPTWGLRNQPLSEEDQLALRSAVVTLKDEERSVSIPYVEAQGVYAISQEEFPLQEGTRYELTVERETQRLTASCEIPKSNNTLVISLSEREKENDPQYGYEPQYLRLTWEDTKDQVNYYNAYAYKNEYYTYYDELGNETQQAYQQRLTYSEGYTSDYLSDGRWLEVEVNYYGYGEGEIKGVLYSVDEHYYEYHQSVYNYTGDNPFAEPQNIYTNVEGDGTGIFCAYSYDSTAIPTIEVEGVEN
ncbi:DUF4249 domain-containing protein [Algivirga pacifica]|uniref:DUF4249 domain-containing protein n=1 Tax=Algivirga pacifica TaxID=1162670 RepID=A0ABP9DKP9_9BACT